MPSKGISMFVICFTLNRISSKICFQVDSTQQKVWVSWEVAGVHRFVCGTGWLVSGGSQSYAGI